MITYLGRFLSSIKKYSTITFVSQPRTELLLKKTDFNTFFKTAKNAHGHLGRQFEVKIF